MDMKKYKHQYYLDHKEYFVNYKKEWRKRNPEKAKAEYARQRIKNLEVYNRLKCKPCTDCGVQHNPWVMQWDHLGDKKFTISSSGHCVSNRVLEEIKKCDLVCANCHADRTHKRRQYHGK
jgi:hypothetical protein